MKGSEHEAPASDSPLAGALECARRGLPVFPIRPEGEVYTDRHGALKTSNGKDAPVFSGFSDHASTDEARILRWAERHPGCNWAIATGCQLPSGRYLVALDVDMKLTDGVILKNGEDSLTKLREGTGVDRADIVKALFQYTPSGQREDGTCEGGHLLMTTEKPVAGGVDCLGPGLDIRAFHNYILAPGSTVGGKRYLPLPDWNGEPAPMPELWVSRLGTPKVKSRNRKPPLDGIDPLRAKQRADRFLADYPPAIEGEGGDMRTLQMFERLGDFGVLEADALSIAEEWNSRCDPPWNPDGFATKCANAYTFRDYPVGCDAPEAVFSEVLPDSPAIFEPTPKRRSIETLDVLDLMNTDPKPVSWLARPFFPAVDFGIFASKSGHGKSYLALQLCTAISTGLPFLGAEVALGGAGILSLEDGPGTIQRRLHAIKKGYGFAWTEEHTRRLVANLRIMVRRPPDASTKSQALELATMANELAESMETTEAKAAVLFLDTLNMIHDGDENSSTETRPLIAAIFGIHDRLECSVWAIHHIRKAGLGRNAPSLVDRNDPELLRGSSALVASARAITQLGWITSREAAKVGLDEDEAATRYAVLALTKANDAPKSPWTFLEHAEDGGTWRMHPRGDMILAQLKNGLDASDLGRAEKILLDLHAGITDRDTLKEKHWPGDEKSADKLKSVLSDMRRRMGWLEKGSVVLTKKGLEKVQEIQGEIQRQANARTAGELFDEN